MSASTNQGTSKGDLIILRTGLAASHSPSGYTRPLTSPEWDQIPLTKSSAGTHALGNGSNRPLKFLNLYWRAGGCGLARPLHTHTAGTHALKKGSIRPSKFLVVYWRSPESGDLWYTSRKERFARPSREPLNSEGLGNPAT